MQINIGVWGEIAQKFKWWETNNYTRRYTMKWKTLATIAALAVLVIILVPIITTIIGAFVYGMNQYESDEDLRICEEVAKQYYETHTYIQNDVFDCDNMACDVWNILKTKGINAEIAVGNVDLDEYDIEDWNHVWIMAETSPNAWIAIECTGGYIVRREDNPRYYHAHFFKNPKSLRDFSRLYETYQTQLSEYNRAIDFYNSLVDEYNNADYFTRPYLERGLQVAKLEMERKGRELDITNAKLEAVLEYG